MHVQNNMYACTLTIDINKDEFSKLSDRSFIIECSTSYGYAWLVQSNVGVPAPLSQDKLGSPAT